ncbi:MAG: VOC family protein [Methylococcaceae bacterium]|jgi:predicted enzyme related to lactoylglutathione lyase
MSGPARAGLFIYAKDMASMVNFYQAIAGMVELHKTDELAVLQSPDIQLLVHRIPAHIADDIHIKSPPERREHSALKFFFTVPKLTDARATALSLGGVVFEENWSGPGFVVCSACDPEGNVFQLRENTD